VACRARCPDRLDHRSPVDRVVALAVDDEQRDDEGTDCRDGVASVGQFPGGCEYRDCVRGASGGSTSVGGDAECDGTPETVAKEADAVVALARPVERAGRVATLAAALVPGTVVEPQAVDTVLGERVGDRPETGVRPTAAVLGVGRTRDDAGAGAPVGGVGRTRLAGHVEGRANVPGTRESETAGVARFARAVALSGHAGR
jgi:hypothetical protein